MDKLIEENFVDKFIVKEKRERTLFELNSAKKRSQIIQRLFNLIDERYTVLSKSKITEEDILKIINQYADINKSSYIIADCCDDGKKLPFKKAVVNMLNYGVCYIIICNDDTVIMRDEVCFGAPPMYILHRK